MDDETWFGTWIEALTRDAVTIDSLGETVVVSHRDTPLVGMNAERVTAYV